MFCTHCGQNLTDTPGKFCVKCGANRSESTTYSSSSHVSSQSGVYPSQQQAIKIPNKSRKLYAIFAVVVVALVIALYFIGVIGGHEIQGRWVFARVDSGFPPSITFSRNGFTAVHYHGGHISGTAYRWPPSPPWRDCVEIGRTTRTCADFRDVQNQDFLRAPLRANGIPLSAAHRSEPGLWRVTQRGNWNISNGRLELVFNCGHILHLNIEYTPNTLYLNGWRFVR